MQPLDISSLYS